MQGRLIQYHHLTYQAALSMPSPALPVACQCLAANSWQAHRFDPIVFPLRNRAINRKKMLLIYHRFVYNFVVNAHDRDQFSLEQLKLKAGFAIIVI